MKRVISFLVCLITIFSVCFFDIEATYVEEFIPYVVDFNLTSDIEENTTSQNSTRATGLIDSYSLYLTKDGSTLHITGQTHGSMDAVRTGFKDLIIQRRKNTDDSWEDYYEYGDVFVDAFVASLNTTLIVPPNYQYRISCKHYAKKNWLMVQTIANTSNIVTTV